MADTKISALSAATALAGTEVIPVVQGGVTVKATPVQMAAYMNLVVESTNVLAQRNGTNAQSFLGYNTYTDASNYERGFFRFSSNVLQIGAEAAGTGTARSIRIGNPGSVGSASPTITIDPAASATGGTQSVVLSVKGNTGFEFNSFNNTNIGNGSGSTTLRASASGGVVVATTFQQFDEVTAPSSPATNKVRIYAEDNGSGKTRLMALFPTGAAVQIAIEP